ncbi:hypothetical protein P8452_71122 [Trifolium repens]|nr:hypothetical protein P8452_71122 [Trifolium repens]
MSTSVSQTKEQVEEVSHLYDIFDLDLDLMMQVESSSSHQVLPENNNSDEALNDSLDKPVFEGDMGNLSPSCLLDRELNLFEDGTLDFDQDFMGDAYADLIFLATIGEFPVPEELEEGEIQE